VSLAASKGFCGAGIWIYVAPGIYYNRTVIEPKSMKVTAAPYGELEFLPSPGDWSYTKIPHSQPYVARGAFGAFFSQYIEAKEYSYWYTVLRPANDLTIHVKKERAWLGFRLLLKQHIRHYTRFTGEVYLRQGQFNFSYVPEADSTFLLKKGVEYVIFDMCTKPDLLRSLDLRIKAVDNLLTDADAGVPSVLAQSAWANVMVLDAVERFFKYPLWDSVAEEVVRQIVQAAASNKKLIDLSEARIESLFSVRDNIRENIKSHINIPYLAQRAGMNEQYFKTGFRQVFGLTPFKYLEYERLKAAKTLLRESHRPLRSIAEETGFKEASSFIRMFTKAEGISPHDWRLRARQNDLP